MENRETNRDKEQIQQNAPSDEIDLRELFRAIGNWFKGIAENLVLGVVIIRRHTLKNKWLLIALLVIGSGLGTSTGFLLDRFYSSSMVVNSYYLNAEIVENIIDKLDELCNDLDYPVLAQQLDVSLDIAKQIRSFSYEKFVTEEEKLEFEIFKETLKNQIDDEDKLDEILPKIELQNQSTYKIRATTYNNAIFPVLEEKIEAYFKNNPYLKKRIEIDRQNKVAKIEKLKYEQTRLDSLKDVLYSNLQKLAVQKRDGSNNVILGEGQLVNPMEVFSRDISFYEEVLALQRQLYIQPEFEVIEGFVKFNSPSSAGFIERAFYGGLIGLGLGYTLIILLGINAYLSEFERKKMENN